MHLLLNIDVPDLERAKAFYCRAFGLTVSRRFGTAAAELTGASCAIYLLEKRAGSRGTKPADDTPSRRTYERHWTPVHFDVVVDDVDAAVLRVVAAGATLETPATSHVWGRIAVLVDPFGHGFCLLQFLNRGYDEITTG